MAYVVAADVRTAVTTDDVAGTPREGASVYPQQECRGAPSTGHRIQVRITVLGGFAVTVEGATTPRSVGHVEGVGNCSRSWLWPRPPSAP